MATEGPIVADKNCEKIHFMSPNIYCCGAGTAADTEGVTGSCKSTHLFPHYQPATPSFLSFCFFSIPLPVWYVLLFHFYCYVENTAPVEALIVVLSQLTVGYLASGGNTMAFLYKLVLPLCMLNDIIFANRMLVIVLRNPFVYFFR